jgi:2-hydroxychromene-2-carboxylate isomerase
MTQPIDFWFTAGSTYTYLSVMRLPALAKAAGAEVRWRIFRLRDILDATTKVVPFPAGSAKRDYMARDIARRADRYGIAIRTPVPYPLPDQSFANRVATLGMREGWGVDYVRAAYRRWFQEGQPSGAEPNLSASLAEVGQDPARVTALANSDEIAAALVAQTNEARQAGLFGSPSFVVGGEVFWGDDRLEDAIAWAKAGSLKRAGY